MKLEDAVVKLIQETANNIKKKQFLMDCELDLSPFIKEIFQQECVDSTILPTLCKVEKTSCIKIKTKPTLTLIEVCNENN